MVNAKNPGEQVNSNGPGNPGSNVNSGNPGTPGAQNNPGTPGQGNEPKRSADGFGTQKATGTKLSNDEIHEDLLENNKQAFTGADAIKERNERTERFNKAAEMQKAEYGSGFRGGIWASLMAGGIGGLAKRMIGGVGPHSAGNVQDLIGSATQRIVPFVEKAVNDSGKTPSSDMFSEKDKALYSLWDPNGLYNGLPKELYKQVRFPRFAQAVQRKYKDLIGVEGGLTVADLVDIYNKFDTTGELRKYNIPNFKTEYENRHSYTDWEKANNAMFDLNEARAKESEIRQDMANDPNSVHHATYNDEIEKTKAEQRRIISQYIGGLSRDDLNSLLDANLDDLNDMQLLARYYERSNRGEQGKYIKELQESGDPDKIRQADEIIKDMNAIKGRMSAMGIDPGLFNDISKLMTSEQMKAEEEAKTEEQRRRERMESQELSNEGIGIISDVESGKWANSDPNKNGPFSYDEMTDKGFMQAKEAELSRGRRKLIKAFVHKYPEKGSEFTVEINRGFKDHYKDIEDPNEALSLLARIHENVHSKKFGDPAIIEGNKIMYRMAKRSYDLLVDAGYREDEAKRLVDSVAGGFSSVKGTIYKKKTYKFSDIMGMYEHDKSDLMKNRRTIDWLKANNVDVSDYEKQLEDLINNVDDVTHEQVHSFLNKEKADRTKKIKKDMGEYVKTLGIPNIERLKDMLEEVNGGKFKNRDDLYSNILELFDSDYNGTSKAYDYMLKKAFDDDTGDLDASESVQWFTDVFGGNPFAKTDFRNFVERHHNSVNPVKFMEYLLSRQA